MQTCSGHGVFTVFYFCLTIQKTLLPFSLMSGSGTQYYIMLVLESTLFGWMGVAEMLVLACSGLIWMSPISFSSATRCSNGHDSFCWKMHQTSAPPLPQNPVLFNTSNLSTIIIRKQSLPPDFLCTLKYFFSFFYSPDQITIQSHQGNMFSSIVADPYPGQDLNWLMAYYTMAYEHAFLNKTRIGKTAVQVNSKAMRRLT